MGIFRLNHAVLFVSGLKESVEFYTEVLGFKDVQMTPEGFNAAFLQAPGSMNDHDLGLFELPAGSPPRSGSGPGLYHLAWEVETLNDLAELRTRLQAAGALGGTSDHGTTKSLYGHDPDGIEFEVVWIVPSDLLTPDALESRKRIGRLDLPAELQRYGADTPGGVGVSR